MYIACFKEANFDTERIFHMKPKTFFAVFGIIMLLATNCASFYFSEAIVNHKKYDVLGVDVSSYQGDINWHMLQQQGVKFAFIKATEGSSFKDSFIASNLKNAADTNIYFSAYHFFSFDSSGKTQAQNFINTVGKNQISLPPVVDVEFYGGKSKNPPNVSETTEILSQLLNGLENYYGKKPIIYTTLPVYLMYIKNSFSDYPLWIRNVRCEPFMLNWSFWQYSGKGLLSGYNGNEKYIDLNVYNGTINEFKSQFL